MNPLAVEAIGSIIRWVLAIGAGYIVKQGIWSPEDSSKYVAAAALAIIALGWSIYQKYGMRLKLLTALATPSVTTEDQVQEKVKTGNTPSVTTPKDQTPTK